ncbi:hypothetical protein CKM354_001216600 [Cercospora kikuchii]|uniref:Uncharacterized protein n=1 Tax=Cercospora kikuchii TaxID=84275 RepID=A0A9P3FLG2_9PEZI|nr:uncharacterized protein CKM354_001216600 [Cercospora kikuchii]GIZ49129.1 hypothetical protein CKM354_001216600 [Cercospora kikuchii]
MVEYLNTSDIHFNHDVADRDSLDQDSDGGSDNSNESYSPYTPEGLVWFFTDFYEFLATLHYDPADLKYPPPEGWDKSMLPNTIMEKKSEGVVEFMRQLPYFRQRADGKSTHIMNGSEIWCTLTGPVDHSNLLVFAAGWESFGRTFIIDVLHGEITEEIVRCDTVSFVEVEPFFEDLKEKYRSLQLIPCPGRITCEAHGIPERSEEIAEVEVLAQKDVWFGGSDLDWQYVRQVYRQFGWPDEFRRDEAFAFLEGFMERNGHRPGDWETSNQ